MPSDVMSMTSSGSSIAIPASRSRAHRSGPCRRGSSSGSPTRSCSSAATASEIPMDDSAAHRSAPPSGAIVGSVLVFRDVTERQRTRDRLREAHTRLESTLAVGEVGTWEFDVPPGRSAATRTAPRSSGRSPGEVEGMSLESFTRGVDAGASVPPWIRPSATRSPSGEPFQVTHRIAGSSRPGTLGRPARPGRARLTAGNVVRLPGGRGRHHRPAPGRGP